MSRELLVNGRIPANTICPFRSECEIAEGGACNHQGIRHNVTFSCASARGFELVRKNREEEATNETIMG